MAEWKLWIVMVLYAWQGLDYYFDNKIGLMIVFIAYAISIIGLIFSARNI